MSDIHLGPLSLLCHEAYLRISARSKLGNWRIIALDDINNHAMVLPMLQSRYHHHSHDTLDPRDANGNTAAVNGIFSTHVPSLTQQLELGQELVLVAGVLAMLEETARAESQDRIPLPLHPNVIVRHGARANRRLKENVVGVCHGDGDQRWLF